GGGCDIPPDVRIAATTRGDVVRCGERSIAEDLETGMVVPLKEGQNEPSDRVRAKVGRNITNSYAASGRAIVGVGLNCKDERCGVLPAPVAKFIKDRTGVVLRHEIKGVDQIAVRPGVVSSQLQRAPKTGHRLFQLPLVLKSGAQVIMRLGN